jgi:hypothetical protein
MKKRGRGKSFDSEKRPLVHPSAVVSQELMRDRFHRPRNFTALIRRMKRMKKVKVRFTSLEHNPIIIDQGIYTHAINPQGRN